jgi:cytochrome oxidase assembly protein ShyY1
MPAVIDSAPDCITHEEVNGSDEASATAAVDDSADFILQANYMGCVDTGGGFMTFGPGTNYELGTGANGAYYALTWIGIAFTVLVLIGWVVYERKRLTSYVAGKVRGEEGRRR